MAKYEAKTKATKESIATFLKRIDDKQQREDSEALIALFKQVTREEPTMWGPSIIGFGSYHYKYDSGHEGDSCLTGFSPRKQALTLYLMGGFDKQPDLMAKLGKYKTGKGCLYIKRLEDVDLRVLKQLIKGTYDFLKKKYA